METKATYEIIDAHVFKPHNSIFKSVRNDAAECTVIACSNKSNCGLYKRGECMMDGSALSAYRCPYGKRSKEKGYTKNARKYSQWIREKEEQYKDVIGGVKGFTRKIAFIGEYVFLPYSHMSMCKALPFASHSSFLNTGVPLLPISLFDVEAIIKLVDFRPQALMGGEITSYQKEEVPKFLLHLKEEMYGVYCNLIAIRPDIEARAIVASHVGRKARIYTCNANTVFVKSKEEWHWDGDVLTCNNTSMISPITKGGITTTIKPNQDAIIEITNDNQVNDETVFID